MDTYLYGIPINQRPLTTFHIAALRLQPIALSLTPCVAKTSNVSLRGKEDQHKCNEYFEFEVLTVTGSAEWLEDIGTYADVNTNNSKYMIQDQGTQCQNLCNKRSGGHLTCCLQSAPLSHNDASNIKNCFGIDPRHLFKPTTLF